MDISNNQIKNKKLELSELKNKCQKKKDENKKIESEIVQKKDLLSRKNTEYFLEMMKNYPSEIKQTGIFEDWTEDTIQSRREIFYEHKKNIFYIISRKYKKHLFYSKFYDKKIIICRLKKVTDNTIKYLSDFKNITERKVYHFLMCDNFETLITNLINNLDEKCQSTKNELNSIQDKINENEICLENINLKLFDEGEKN